MNYPTEMSLYLLQHSELIGQPSLTDEVELAVFRAINARIAKRMKSLATWRAHCAVLTGDEEGNDDTSFAPLHWPLNRKGWLIAGYRLGETAPDVNISWLADAVGLNDTKLCFEFWMDGRVGGPSKTKINRRVQEFYVETPALKEAGFLLKESGTIYIPFSFDVSLLATEFPDFTKSLAPLDVAFDALLKVHEHIDALVTGLQSSKDKTSI